MKNNSNPALLRTSYLSNETIPSNEITAGSEQTLESNRNKRNFASFYICVCVFRETDKKYFKEK
jgi:hypothetical protein